MARESNLWHTFNENIGPFGMLKRIEDSTADGTADVLYCLTRPKLGSLPASGVVELKRMDAYPAKRSTPVRPRSLTKDQVLFAEDWARAGGRAWLLLYAPPWYLLFAAADIRGLYDGSVAAMDAPAVAKAAGMGRFPTGPILRCLTA